MTMLEKMARAMFRADPDSYGEEDVMWSGYTGQARAALEAIRELGLAAIKAGEAEDEGGWGAPACAATHWSLIIDHALSEQP